MSKSTHHRPNLQLIENREVDRDVVARLDTTAALKAEARDFAARNGNNPYSDFILKHGCRPNRDHAAILGRLINRRVRASDGSLQPKLTSEDRERWREYRAGQKKERALAYQISVLTAAIRDLSEITAEPNDLVCGIGPVFDRPVISEKLDIAVELLRRFAAKWREHEQGQIQRGT